MGTATQLMTAEQLYHMPDDGFRYELVRGELRKMSPAGLDHGLIASNLHAALNIYNHQKSLGRVISSETGYRLAQNPDTVRAPDIAFISNERLTEIGRTEKFSPGAPDLAIEVLSPDDRTFEIEEKIQDYLAAGVRLVWVVSPKLRTVTVYKPDGKIVSVSSQEVLEGGDVLPGFRLPVLQIFD